MDTPDTYLDRGLIQSKYSKYNTYLTVSYNRDTISLFPKWDWKQLETVWKHCFQLWKQLGNNSGVSRRLDARSGVPGTEGQTVNGEPLRLRWSKGCLWIDLDERIRSGTFPSEEDKVSAAGGAWMIPKVQNFAKMRLRRIFLV